MRSTQTVEQNASDTIRQQQCAVSVANALPNAPRPRGGDTSKSTSGRTEETTNYEISKKVTTSTEDGGDVKKLSVAVVVDGSGDTAHAYKPRTPAEMAQDHRLVKSAMGFDAARGDQVQVTNMQFARMDDTASGTPAPKPLLGLDGAYWFKIIEAAIMCVTALLIGLFVARPLITRMFAAQAAADRGGPSAIANASPVAGALPAPAAARGRSRRWRSPADRPAAARAQHRYQPHRRPGAANPPSRKSVKWSRRIPKKRWRSSAPGCINRYNPCRKPQKPLSKTISASLTGAERAAIIMLSLGEDHSAKHLGDDGRGGDQGSLPGDVQSGLDLRQPDRKAAGGFRLPDVGHRLADGFL